MKKRSGYWWIFWVSGIVWAIGIIGVIVGMVVYPESNLLGGLGLVFLPIALLGGGVFKLTLVVSQLASMDTRLTALEDGCILT